MSARYLFLPLFIHDNPPHVVVQTARNQKETNTEKRGWGKNRCSRYFFFKPTTLRLVYTRNSPHNSTGKHTSPGMSFGVSNRKQFVRSQLGWFCEMIPEYNTILHVWREKLKQYSTCSRSRPTVDRGTYNCMVKNIEFPENDLKWNMTITRSNFGVRRRLRDLCIYVYWTTQPVAHNAPKTSRCVVVLTYKDLFGDIFVHRVPWDTSDYLTHVWSSETKDPFESNVFDTILSVTFAKGRRD